MPPVGLKRKLTSEHIVTAIRFRIADWIDKRRPDACWAELATWAMCPEHYKLRDIFDRDSGLYRRSCQEYGDIPYCGKCEKLGRWNRKDGWRLVGEAKRDALDR